MRDEQEKAAEDRSRPRPGHQRAAGLRDGLFACCRHRFFIYNKRELQQGDRGPFLNVTVKGCLLPPAAPGAGATLRLRAALKMSGEGGSLNKNPYTPFSKVTPSFLGHKSIC